MVKIVDYKECQRKDGSFFYALEVQGGLEFVKSETTGNSYATAKKALIPSTFNEEFCKSLLGDTIPGVIEKVAVAPYQYKDNRTGELKTRSERYTYITEEDKLFKDNVVASEVII